MLQLRRFLLCVLIFVPLAAHAAAINQILDVPSAGTAGRFSGPALNPIGLDAGVRPKAVAAAVANYKASSDDVRGGAESTLYANISPSVVLVFTDKGLGSGSIVSADGQVLTNYHVVEGYDKVGVLLKPAKEGEKPSSSNAIIADVLKVDPKADLALLKMRTAPPAAAKPIIFGDFNKVQVGDDVDAIGHPEGESWTFTKGYVSQIRRDYQWKNEDGNVHTADVIQTQTPINPGNSGGPLLTNGGQLIGVNAFKANDSEGLNFAIGVDSVQSFMKSKGLTPEAARKSTKCEPKDLFTGRSKDNTASIRQMDVLCHGKVDVTFVLPDDKSQPLTAIIDMEETGKPQGVVLSNNRDGHWDISYWDTKGAGKFDMLGHHPDGQIIPSSYEPFTDDGK